MTQVSELTLEVLQHMAQTVLDEVRVIRTDQREVIQRLGRLERLTADLHRDWVQQNVRLDNLGHRLTKIETRLDLT